MSELKETMFLPQTTLEAWLETGQAEASGPSITLEGRDYGFDLEPAFRVVSVVEGDSDSPLIGKVLPERILLDVGGEVLESSAIFEETAFEIVPGFIATVRRAAGNGATADV